MVANALPRWVYLNKQKNGYGKEENIRADSFGEIPEDAQESRRTDTFQR